MLTKGPESGHDVSTNAEKCPKGGASIASLVVAPNGDSLVPTGPLGEAAVFPEPRSPERASLTPRPLKLSGRRKLIIPAIVVVILCLLFRPQPLTYHLATIAPQFGISESEAKTIVQDAAERWNAALNKPAIKIDPGTAGAVINFVFDYRQEYKNSLVSINGQYSELDITKRKIDLEKNLLEVENSRLDKEYASLNSDIAYWNAKGGATGTKYTTLVARRKTYTIEVKAYDKRYSTLRTEISAYNLRIVAYNKAITKTETTFKLAGGTSGENAVGLYEPKDRSITIYSYSDAQDLRFILMHELGHALGCAHATVPSSIMYPVLTKAQNLENPMPTTEDLALLGKN